MKRTLAIVFGLLIATPAFAGLNPDAELAMHLVAGCEYLYCPELAPGGPNTPGDCLGINNDLSVAELAQCYYYAYVVLVAYNVTGFNAVEYCIGGWPTGRGNPPLPALMLCPEVSIILGDPFVAVGIQSLGGVVAPDLACGGLVMFGYFSTGNLAPYLGALPITLAYCPSAYSYAADPHNFVIDENFVEDNVVSEHGCTIGGVHWEPVPYDDCNPQATATDPTTWSNVKSMYK
jgi:hypothetical protein